MRSLLPTLAALVLLVPPAPAQAPAGFITADHPETGLSWHAPKTYNAVPLPPTEGTFIAKYVRGRLPASLEKAVRRLRGGDKFRPQIQVFALIPEARATGEQESRSATTVREAMEARSRVATLEEFQKRYLRGWEVKKVEKREGEFTLSRNGSGQAAPKGYMIVKTEEGVSVGFLGTTLAAHERKLRVVLMKMARGLERGESGGRRSENEALDRLYRNKDYRAVERRKEVRRNLSRGWKAIDTDNYVIVHHSKDTRLVNKIARDMEAMQAFYAKLFPPAREIETVSIVRVCRTKAEYHFYGGRQGTGGFFHPGNEELVLYDYGETQKRRSFTGEEAGRRVSDRDTLLVLYHEAFHQYVYYAVGQVSPHDWFNEGHGDYFSGAKIPTYGKKVRDIGPSSWRLHRAKDQCEHGIGFVPLKKLLYAERPEFYNPRNAGNYYAAAWSFVYFLRESRAAKRRKDWREIPDRYYDTMKEVYARELGLRKDPSLGEKQMAGARAKKEALTAALKGIDLDELEEAWKTYVVRMKDPWPHLRKKR